MKLFHRIFGKQESLKACPFCGSKVEAVKGKGVLPIVAIRCLNDKCGADISDRRSRFYRIKFM